VSVGHKKGGGERERARCRSSRPRNTSVRLYHQSCSAMPFTALQGERFCRCCVWQAYCYFRSVSRRRDLPSRKQGGMALGRRRPTQALLLDGRSVRIAFFSPSICRYLCPPSSSSAVTLPNPSPQKNSLSETNTHTHVCVLKHTGANETSRLNGPLQRRPHTLHWGPGRLPCPDPIAAFALTGCREGELCD
jgi:hypothetical protein